MTKQVAGILLILLTTPLAAAQDIAGANTEPVLRVDAGGPTAYVTALAFSPDGRALYAGGMDKVLHSWTLGQEGRFTPRGTTYRVPIGPGAGGLINAMAMSANGEWVAVAGRGLIRGEAGFDRLGVWVPTSGILSDAMWEDQGTIYVFNTRTGKAKQLRGHRGWVLSLAFAPAQGNAPVLLASAARELKGKKYVGGVRLWDVEKGVEVDRLLTLPEPIAGGRALWPRLAVVRGKPPRVAIAWEDGVFRVWDADGKGQVAEKEDGPHNNTVAALPEADRFLTASSTQGGAVLKVWNTARGLAEVRRKALPAGHKPRALELFASKRGGRADHAALIVEAPAENNEVAFLLHIFDLAELKTVRASIPLWKGPAMTPILAVSPGGRFLAMAGNRDYAGLSYPSVFVYPVADLLKNEDTRQVLRGSGAVFGSAAFVKNGNRPGLLLTGAPRKPVGQAARAPKDGDVIFDLARSSLLADATGWQLDTPAAGDWSVAASAPPDERGRPRVQFQVREGKKVVGTVRLQPDQFVWDYALLPPCAPLHEPLVAVAYVQLGQPMLTLFHGRTGAVLRQFTGHLDRIHSVAFSGDGRLLVTAGADQTVCVWTLDGLDRVLGRMALLPGLAITDGDKGGLLVRELDAAALDPRNRTRLEKAGVQEGDQLEGFVVQNTLQPLPSAGAYYEGVAALDPGDTVVLRFRGRGDVTLVVGQGADEHKPLFSLFLTRPVQKNARQWVGWSPVGPYDISGPDVEPLLGWHRNTGDPRQPTTFVAAQEYREQNFKSGILAYLVQYANHGPADEAWKRDHPKKRVEPQMSLYIQEVGPNQPVDERGAIRIERPRATLVLSIQKAPAGKIRAVRWSLSEKDSGEFGQVSEREWSADLSRVAWQRGEQTVKVVVQTAAPDSQEYRRELLLRYRPAPPVLRPVGPLPLLVDKPEYRLQAEVVPGEGQEVQVTVSQTHKGKDLLNEKPATVREKTRIERTLKLEPGQNEIKVLAHNVGAGNDEAETTRLPLVVRYRTGLRVTLSAVVLSPDTPALLIEPGRPLAVDLPRVRIVGDIEAVEKITAAAWGLGDKRQPLPLDKEKPNRLAISQEVTLTRPGEDQKVRFTAKTENSDEQEAEVVLRYQPRLPQLRLTSPAQGKPLYEGQDPLKVAVEGRWTWSAAHPCTAQVLVNGKEQGQPIAVAANSATLTADAPLQPGDNWVQVRLKNDWHEAVTPRVLVPYRRPPRIVSLDAPANTTEPFVELTALVESPKELPLIRVRIRGSELPADAVKPVVAEQKGDRVVYRIVLRQLPVQRGENVIEFQAANADDWARKPGMVKVTGVEPKKAPPAKAEVSILDPRRSCVVSAPEFRVRFQVRSRSPLTRIELERNGTRISKVANPGKLPKTGEFYEVRQTVNVSLEAGDNTLKVLADNAGGEQVSPAVTINYQVPTVRVDIEHLQVGELRIEPNLALEDGRLFFPAAALDRVTVQGRVRWEAGADSMMERASQVRISVNGYRQPPAVLEPVGNERRVRQFTATVGLHRARGNFIAVRVPDVIQDADSRCRCLVDCTQPGVGAGLKRQAHLLVIDSTADDESKVRQRVYDAFKATPAGTNRFTKAGFADDGRLYGPLVGSEVTPDTIEVQLLHLTRVLRERAAAGAVNDVVFLYFRGGEAVEASGHFFRTSGGSSASADLRWSSITFDELRRFCADNLGAQVVLLDVTRDPGSRKGPAAPDRVLQWPDDANVAVWRYAWVGLADEQPDDARLTTDWKKAQAEARHLGDVAERVAARFAPLSQSLRPSLVYPDKLTFTQHLPAGVAEIEIGRP